MQRRITSPVSLTGAWRVIKLFGGKIQEYRNDSDRIGQFIEAWLEEGDAFEVRSSAAYKLYSDWCKKYNYNAENVKNFKKAIKEDDEEQEKIAQTTESKTENTNIQTTQSTPEQKS